MRFIRFRINFTSSSFCFYFVFSFSLSTRNCKYYVILRPYTFNNVFLIIFNYFSSLWHYCFLFPILIRTSSLYFYWALSYYLLLLISLPYYLLLLFSLPCTWKSLFLIITRTSSSSSSTVVFSSLSSSTIVFSFLYL